MVKYGGENNFSVFFFSRYIHFRLRLFVSILFFLSMFIFAIFSFSLVVAGAPLLMFLFAFQHIILYYFRFVHKIYGRHNLRILNSFPHFDCLVLRLWFCLLIYIYFFLGSAVFHSGVFHFTCDDICVYITYYVWKLSGSYEHRVFEPP